jgi:uncharacterized protein (DUF2236 family)
VAAHDVAFRTAGDPGLYGPGSEAWRLNREAMLLLGAGPRALLLQVAHPLIAEGVNQHSDFRRDPWRRLQATLRSFLTVVYGSGPSARAEIRRLNALHRSISGPVRDPAARLVHGATYSARDPDLSLWVHATLVDSTIATFDAWIRPLSVDQRARYYEETRPIGLAFGIDARRLPRDIEAFQAYMEAMIGPSGPVRPTAVSRRLAREILRPPLGPLFPPLGIVPFVLYGWAFWPSLGLLPPSVRDELGLSWGARERLVSAWLVAGYRAWRPRIPAGLRWMPQARAADRRTAPDRGARPAATAAQLGRRGQ